MAKQQQRRHSRPRRQQSRSASAPAILGGVAVKGLLCSLLNFFLWLPGRRAN